MPGDAKLGLVVGVGLVIVVAVVFFGRDPAPANGNGNVGQAAAPGVDRLAVSPQRPLERTHILQAGDTLYGLARQYYGDGDRFADIYHANKAVLLTPDRLPVGAAIRIP
jgi:nucleoid-associated protein YgaU